MGYGDFRKLRFKMAIALRGALRACARYHLIGAAADWGAFEQVDAYTFSHFRGPKHGE